MPDKPFEVEYDDEEDEEATVEVEKTKKNNSKNSEMSTYKAPVAPLKPNLITSTYVVNSPVTSTVANVAKKEEKPTIDTSGVKVGSMLIHKTFGKGKVTALTNGLITVAFGQAEKKFQFPDAIVNGFLKME
jgi:hypothetical protein